MLKPPPHCGQSSEINQRSIASPVALGQKFVSRNQRDPEPLRILRWCRMFLACQNKFLSERSKLSLRPTGRTFWARRGVGHSAAQTRTARHNSSSWAERLHVSGKGAVLAAVRKGRKWRVQITQPGLVRYFGRFTSKKRARDWISAHTWADCPCFRKESRK
jgi:hypothetical protein